MEHPLNGLLFTRWRRHGYDRLYVRSCEGAEYGYLDRATGTLHPAEGSSRQALYAALFAGGHLPAVEIAVEASVEGEVDGAPRERRELDQQLVDVARELRARLHQPGVGGARGRLRSRWNRWLSGGPPRSVV